MVVEAGMFNNKGTNLLRTQDEGTLAVLEHGKGHPMVRQCLSMLVQVSLPFLINPLMPPQRPHPHDLI